MRPGAGRAVSSSSRNSTSPDSREYSAPTIISPSSSISCSRISEPCRRWSPRCGCWRAPHGAERLGSCRQVGPSRRSTAGRTRSTMERRLRDWSRRPRSSRAWPAMAPHWEWPEHDDQARAKARGGELDAADLRGRDDVAGDADHEQVAQPLVEDDLGRHARVGAAQDDGEGLLPGNQRAAPRLGGAAGRVAHLGDEAPVALAQQRQRLRRRYAHFRSPRRRT